MVHRQRHLEAFILLLVVALLAALGFALWQQQQSQDSGAAERSSCHSAQYARGDAGRPALEPVVTIAARAPRGRHPYAQIPGWEAWAHNPPRGGSTPPCATTTPSERTV
jgi:hypothetical protein